MGPHTKTRRRKASSGNKRNGKGERENGDEGNEELNRGDERGNNNNNNNVWARGNVNITNADVLCYIDCCDLYRTPPDPGVLVALRFRREKLKISEDFNDLAMLPLCETLKSLPTQFSMVVLDFSGTRKLTSNGAVALSYLLSWNERGSGSSERGSACGNYLKELILRGNKIGSHGAIALARVLMSGCYTHLGIIDLSHCGIGQRGGKAWTALIRASSPRTAYLDTCTGTGTTVSETTTIRGLPKLRFLDLSLNYIGSDETEELKKATRLRNLAVNRLHIAQKQKYSDDTDSGTEIHNQGNNGKHRVISNDGCSCCKAYARKLSLSAGNNSIITEVLNSVTHGLGVTLGIIGTVLMAVEVNKIAIPTEMEFFQRRSCIAIYSASLLVLYISSTLYHSFFQFFRVKMVFKVMDLSAIYILIAGSYTPFLGIVLADQPLYSTWLLGFMWLCAVLGITLEALTPGSVSRYEHLIKHRLSIHRQEDTIHELRPEALIPNLDRIDYINRMKNRARLVVYLGMGWSGIVAMPELNEKLASGALQLILLGGLAYTGGVPFFKRDVGFDHGVWHLFVLFGSIFHFLAVYLYVIPLDPVIQ